MLISGLGADHQYWSSVQKMLVKDHRVCWYDRAGLGLSAKRAGALKVASKKQAAELRAVLTAVGETGPLVIVGHSYGGLLARTFANRYASSTAGLALIDASYATQWQGGSRYWGERKTIIDMRKTEKFTLGVPQMGAKPLAVVGAGLGTSLNWHRKLAEMKRLGQNSIQVTARNSYHVVMYSQPAVVTEAIAEVWTSAVTGATIPNCKANIATWSALGAYCGRKKANSQ